MIFFSFKKCLMFFRMFITFSRPMGTCYLWFSTLLWELKPTFRTTLQFALNICPDNGHYKAVRNVDPRSKRCNTAQRKQQRWLILLFCLFLFLTLKSTHLSLSEQMPSAHLIIIYFPASASITTSYHIWYTKALCLKTKMRKNKIR